MIKQINRKSIPAVNLDMNIVHLGMAKKKIDLMVRSEESSENDLKEMINHSMLILRDSSTKSKMGILNNARNSILDSLRSIKYSFL